MDDYQSETLGDVSEVRRQEGGGRVGVEGGGGGAEGEGKMMMS